MCCVNAEGCGTRGNIVSEVMDVVIVAAVRTPIGKFQGAFAKISAPQLGAAVIREVLKRSNVNPVEVDEVIMGNVVSAGIGQAPARQASLFAGVPDSVNAFTVNKVCGSGLKAVVLAAQSIRLGDATIVVAGGMENMSLAPYLLEKARTGYRLGNGQVIDALIKDGLWDPYNDFHMGQTAELVSQKFGIGREEQDGFARMSYEKARKAQTEGWFKEEIVGVEVKEGKTAKTAFEDEEPNASDLAKMSVLRPAFLETGTVTAANASKISDGAAALVLMSGEEAAKRGLKPLARVAAYAQGAVEPKWVMMAPVCAVEKLYAKTGWTSETIDLFEVNEAFSVQAVAVAKELKIPADRLNVHGGAVALGHPIGCSGARILVTLLSAMARRNAKRGLATLCNGGGESVVMGVER